MNANFQELNLDSITLKDINLKYGCLDYTTLLNDYNN